MSRLGRSLAHGFVALAVVVAPLTVLAGSPAHAAVFHPPGSLDASFGNFSGVEQFGNGFTTALDSMAIQPDGKIVAAFIGGGGIYVARRLSDGSADPAWAGGDSYFWPGAVTPGDDPKGALAQDAQGRTYVTSALSSGGEVPAPVVAVIRLTTGGALDPDWGSNGTVTIPVGGNPNDHGTGIAIDPATGRVYVSMWQGPNGNTDFGVAALTPSGALDAGFANGGIATTDFNGGDDTARDVVVTPDGGVFVAGYVKASGGGHDIVGIWRLTATGAAAPSFGNAGRASYDIGSPNNSGARSVARDGDTYFVSVRDEYQGTSGGVVEFDGKGQPVNGFGSGSSGTGVYRTRYASPSDNAGIAVDAHGRVLVAGGAGLPTVARLVPGRYPNDTTFAGTGLKTLTCPNGATAGGAGATAVQPDGQILVVGVCQDTSQAANASVPTIWRLYGGDQVIMASTPVGGGQDPVPNAPPDTVDSAKLTASAIDVNGTGRNAVVAPGGSVHLTYSWSISAGGSGVYCPGCIDQVVSGFTNPGPENCVEAGQPQVTGGSGAVDATFTAPTRMGHYYLAFQKVFEYGCGAGAGHWLGDGKFWPGDTAPQSPAFLAEVTVAGLGNASVTPGQHTVPAGHHVTPVAGIPLDALTATLSDLQAAPLRGSPLRGSPLRGSPLRGSPLRGSPLRGSPLRGSPLRGSPLRGSPIPLSELPLTPPASWAAVLANTIYANQPLQNVTLQQVLALPSPNPLDTYSLADVDISRTPLRNVSLVAFLLGNTPVANLGLTGLPAGIDTTQSLIGLELAGLDLSGVYRQGVHFVGKTLVDAPISGIRLGDLWLAQTPLGPIPTSAVPSPWYSCTPACATLADAQAQNLDTALTNAATLGALTTTIADPTIGQLMPGLIPRDQLGYQNLSTAAIADASPVPATGLPYTATFTMLCGGASTLSAAFHLPAGFRAIPGSGTLSVPGATLGTVTTLLGASSATVSAPIDACTGQLTGTATVQAEAGYALGATSDSVTISYGGGSADGGDPAPVTVVDNAATTPLPQDAGNAVSTMFLGRISSPGELDHYTLPQPPAGSDLTITLSHVTPGHDDDLSVFGPGTPDLRGAPLRGSPLRGSPLRGSAVDDATLDPATSATTAGTDVQADVPVQPPAGSTVLGVSANRGSSDESVTYHVPEGLASGGIDVVVSGYNGSTDPAGAPYALLVAVSPPPGAPVCAAPSFPNAGSGAAGGSVSVPADTQTLILTDQQRLGDLYGSVAASTAMGKLTTLAARSDVKGVVVPVEANASVASAYAAWDGASRTPTSPCSAASANAVVAAINAYVDSLLSTNHPGLKSIVIAGGDQVVPFARLIDRMALDNETSYANDEVYNGQDNPTSGSLRAGYLLSDDPYGDFNPIPWLDGQAYVPDVALGRLVETPTDIGNAVDAFVASNGVRTPNAAYTAGYDFNADGAQQVANTLAPRVPAGTATTSINGTWTKADAVNGLTTAAHGYDSINAHYDAYRSLPANEFSAGTQNQLLTTADLPASLSGSVLFTIGCHAGLSVADTFVTASGEAPRQADWAQTIASRGGLYAANTGYGYGDTTAVAYSEKLMADFAQNLDGSMSVGQALMFAKQRGVHLPLSVVDVKVMEEATFYGLPMYRLGSAGTSASSVLPIDPAVSPTPTTASGTPVTADFTTASGRHLAQQNTSRGTLFVVQNGTGTPEPPLAIPGRPIEPQTTDSYPLRSDALRAHGVLLTGLSSHVTSTTGNFDPVYSSATPDISTTSPEPGTLGSYFPSSLIGLVERATTAGLRDTVVLTPGQFRAASSSTGLGFQQLADSMTYQLLYSNSDDVQPPAIDSVNGGVSGSTVTFTVHTPDNDAASASALFLTRSGTSAQAWTLVPLTSSDGHTFTGSASVVGFTSVDQYFVQLVDTSNNVSTSSKKGQDFTAVTPPAPSAPVVAVDGTQVNGSYVGPQQVSVTGDGTLTYALDGGSAQPYAGPFTVSSAGPHTVVGTNGGGSASLTFTIAGPPPPTVSITSPSASQVYVAGAPIAPQFTCTGYGATTCTPSPAVPDNSVGTHTFSVTARDSGGRTATGSVTYTVGKSPFLGFFQPVNDPPGSTMSVFKQGSTIPLKFQIVDVNGVPISDAFAASLATACFATVTYSKTGSTSAPVDESVYTTAGDSGGCFRYDASGHQFVYNLSTKPLSAGATYALQAHFVYGYTVDHTVVVGLR